MGCSAIAVSDTFSNFIWFRRSVFVNGKVKRQALLNWMNAVSNADGLCLSGWETKSIVISGEDVC